MRIFLIVLSLTLSILCPLSRAEAASDCTQKVCVEVYTDTATNQLVIKARKGSGPVVPKASTSPAPVKHVAPKPVVTRKPRAYVYRPYTPRPHRTSHIVKAATSLADQLSQLIPTHNFYYQPSPSALVGIPVYFWSDTNPQFSTVVTLLGEAISVDLTPSFIFNFGDGSPDYQSDSPGAAFPTGNVTHTYHHPGDFLATLYVTWGGQWSVAGLINPVLGGAITQNYQQMIHVAAAPTKYLH